MSFSFTNTKIIITITVLAVAAGAYLYLTRFQPSDEIDFKTSVGLRKLDLMVEQTDSFENELPKIILLNELQTKACQGISHSPSFHKLVNKFSNDQISTDYFKAELLRVTSQDVGVNEALSLQLLGPWFNWEKPKEFKQFIFTTSQMDPELIKLAVSHTSTYVCDWVKQGLIKNELAESLITLSGEIIELPYEAISWLGLDVKAIKNTLDKYANLVRSNSDEHESISKWDLPNNYDDMSTEEKKRKKEQIKKLTQLALDNSVATQEAVLELESIFLKQNKKAKQILELFGHSGIPKDSDGYILRIIGNLKILSNLGVMVNDFYTITNQNGLLCNYAHTVGCELAFGNVDQSINLFGTLTGDYNVTTFSGIHKEVLATIKWTPESGWDIFRSLSMQLGLEVFDGEDSQNANIAEFEFDDIERHGDKYYNKKYDLGLSSTNVQVHYVQPTPVDDECIKVSCRPKLTFTKSELLNINWKHNELVAKKFVSDLGISEVFQVIDADLRLEKSGAILDLVFNAPSLNDGADKFTLSLDLLDSKTFEKTHLQLNDFLYEQVIYAINDATANGHVQRWKLPNQLSGKMVLGANKVGQNPLMINFNVVDQETGMRFDVLAGLNDDLSFITNNITLDQNFSKLTLASKTSKSTGVAKTAAAYNQAQNKAYEQLAKHIKIISDKANHENLSDPQRELLKNGMDQLLIKAMDKLVFNDQEQEWDKEKIQNTIFKVNLAGGVFNELMQNSNFQRDIYTTIDEALIVVNDASRMKAEFENVLINKLDEYVVPFETIEGLSSSFNEFEQVQNVVRNIENELPEVIQINGVANEGFKLNYSLAPSTTVSDIPIVLTDHWNNDIVIQGQMLDPNAQSVVDKLTSIGDVVEGMVEREAKNLEAITKRLIDDKKLELCGDLLGGNHGICQNPNIILRFDDYSQIIFNRYTALIKEKVKSQVTLWTNADVRNVHQFVRTTLVEMGVDAPSCKLGFNGRSVLSTDLKKSFDENLKDIFPNGDVNACFKEHLHNHAKLFIPDVLQALEDSQNPDIGFWNDVPECQTPEFCLEIVNSYLDTLEDRLWEEYEYHKREIIRVALINMIEQLDSEAVTQMISWIDAIESGVYAFAEKTGIPGLIGGVCVSDDLTDFQPFKPDSCAEGYKKYTSIDDINFDGMLDEQVENAKNAFRESANVICLDTFNFDVEGLGSSDQFCSALNDPDQFTASIKGQADALLNHAKTLAKNRIDALVNQTVDEGVEVIEETVRRAADTICKRFTGRTSIADDNDDNNQDGVQRINATIFGVQIEFDHECPLPPNLVNLKAGFTLMGQHFEILSGINLNPTNGDDIIDFNKLVISPRIETVIAQKLTEKYEGLTVSNASITNDTFYADIKYQPGKLPWPIESRIEIAGFLSNPDININFDINNLLHGMLGELATDVCSHVEDMARNGLNLIPLTEYVDGSLDLQNCANKIITGNFGIDFDLKTTLFRGFEAIVPVTISAAEGIKIQAPDLNGPFTEFIKTKWPIDVIQPDDPFFTTDGGLELHLIADLKVEGLPGFNIKFPFTIGKKFKPRGALELVIPGWYPAPPFAFGNLGASFDIDKEIVGFKAAVSFTEGTAMSKIVRVDGAGSIGMKNKKIEMTGDLIVSDFLNMASARADLNIDEKFFETTVNSAPMLKDMFELKGYMKIQDKDPAPFLLASGYGSLFGAEAAEAKFDLKLKRKLAAQFDAVVEMPIGNHEISVRSQDHFKNLEFLSIPTLFCTNRAMYIVILY